MIRLRARDGEVWVRRDWPWHEGDRLPPNVEVFLVTYQELGKLRNSPEIMRHAIND